MKNITLKNFALLFAVMFALSSCASMRVAKDPHAPYLGNWEYVVEELPVDIDGTMILSKVEGVLTTVLSNPMGDMEIEGATIVDGTFKAEFDAQGNIVELEGKFDGDSYNGFLIVQDTEFVMNAKRVE